MFKKKKLDILEKLAELYIIMSKHVPNPDSVKANQLFVYICKGIMKDGYVEFANIIADKYGDYIAKDFADNSVH